MSIGGLPLSTRSMRYGGRERKEREVGRMGCVCVLREKYEVLRGERNSC